MGFDEAPAESVDDAVGVAVGAAESEAETVVAPFEKSVSFRKFWT